MQIKKSPMFLDLLIWILEMKMEKKFTPYTRPGQSNFNETSTKLCRHGGGAPVNKSMPGR